MGKHAQSGQFVQPVLVGSFKFQVHLLLVHCEYTEYTMLCVHRIPVFVITSPIDLPPHILLVRLSWCCSGNWAAGIGAFSQANGGIHRIFD